MKFDARLPADFPILPDQPVWLFLALLAIVMGVIWTLNNFYFAWMRRGFPGLFRPRALLTALLLCIAVIVVGLIANPPNEIQQKMKQRMQSK
jgi:hypothetical protein